ncbi:MAG: hypothetical protein OEY14_15020 [Myxococcales bacterium]|nr:hypothetical protein [Myxococcales bacterium]
MKAASAIPLLELLGRVSELGERDLSRAQTRAVHEELPLVAALVDAGCLGEEELADLLAEAVGSVVIDLEEAAFDSEALALMPEAQARRHLLIPVGRDADRLRVVFADPLDAAAIRSVRACSALEIEPLVATVGALRAALDRVFLPVDLRPALLPELAPEPTRRLGLPGTLPPEAGTHPMHRLEQSATLEQRHEALLLALIEAGALTRADYIDALRRLLGSDRRR